MVTISAPRAHFASPFRRPVWCGLAAAAAAATAAAAPPTTTTTTAPLTTSGRHEEAAPRANPRAPRQLKLSMFFFDQHAASFQVSGLPVRPASQPASCAAALAEREKWARDEIDANNGVGGGAGAREPAAKSFARLFLAPCLALRGRPGCLPEARNRSGVAPRGGPLTCRVNTRRHTLRKGRWRRATRDVTIASARQARDGPAWPAAAAAAAAGADPQRCSTAT